MTAHFTGAPPSPHSGTSPSVRGGQWPYFEEFLALKGGHGGRRSRVQEDPATTAHLTGTIPCHNQGPLQA
jgi:hypothetical protein